MREAYWQCGVCALLALRADHRAEVERQHAEQIDYWREEARRYAQNADYWRVEHVRLRDEITALRARLEG